MISTELWRTTVGGWTSEQLLPISCDHFSSLITYSFGISTWLLAVVISILLIIGGVNPGPTGKNPNSSSTEHDLFDSGN